MIKTIFKKPKPRANPKEVMDSLITQSLVAKILRAQKEKRKFPKIKEDETK